MPILASMRITWSLSWPSSRQTTASAWPARCFEEEGYSSASQSFEGRNHVAGGCQMFRRRCFEDVGGFVANKAGGVDWIAVTTARMKGWKTESFREKSFFHLRHLGTAERSAFASCVFLR